MGFISHWHYYEKKCAQAFLLVPASSPSMIGLPDEHVNADMNYTLECFVERSKPAATVVWVINHMKQPTHNTFAATDPWGSWNTTGTLLYPQHPAFLSILLSLNLNLKHGKTFH